MRHWYLLAKDVSSQCRSQRLSYLEAFSADHGPRDKRLSREVRNRMLWLGLIEVLPLVGAFIFGLEWNVPYGLIVLGGLAATILLCYLLRKLTPLTPIHLAAPRPLHASISLTTRAGSTPVSDSSRPS